MKSSRSDHTSEGRAAPLAPAAPGDGITALLFTIAGQTWALDSRVVVEILRAVTITPLPGAPSVVEGVIDIGGLIVPVFDLRRRLGLPRKPIELGDNLIVARRKGRLSALHADAVLDLVAIEPSLITAASALTTTAEHIAGVASLNGDVALIHDLDTFLTEAEAQTLEEALS